MEFFWTGGGCAACLKGFRMLAENESLNLGIEILWSAKLFDKLGPVGMEPGNVKKSVNRANSPTLTRRREIRRGPRRTPRTVGRFGILKRKGK